MAYDWRKPPVLALAAVPGAALGVLKEPSRASLAAWVAAGAAVRTLHDAPLPPWPSSQCQQQPALSSRGTVEFPPKLESECEWLVANDVVSADVVRRNREIAEAALRPWTPVFIHSDLQIVHVFVDGDEVSGVVDWSEGGQGDAMYDLATLTLARGAPRRCHRGLWRRHRDRRDSRVLVVAKFDGDPIR